MLVCFIGVDGSGKTSAAAHVDEILTKKHLACKHSHYEYSLVDRAPRVLKSYARRFLLSDGNGGSSGASREGGRKSQLMTLLLFLAAVLDNLIERVKEIEPYRNDVIIYDRYFYDHLVRLGLSWPPWLTRAYLQTVPKPDLTILLDVSASTAYNRKPEVSIALLSQQRSLYLKLGQLLDSANFIFIDAELPPERVYSLIDESLAPLLNHFAST